MSHLRWYCSLFPERPELVQCYLQCIVNCFMAFISLYLTSQIIFWKLPVGRTRDFVVVVVVVVLIAKQCETWEKLSTKSESRSLLGESKLSVAWGSWALFPYLAGAAGLWAVTRNIM